MGAADFTKALFDSLDKITDILNVGRLIFYTSSGFIILLPAAMLLRLLSRGVPKPYWQQFVLDLMASGKHPAVWLASLVLGFVFATFASAIVMNRFSKVPPSEIQKTFYAYQYPRLFSGGVRLKDTTSKDYAAWLLSEYYRYVEIAVFIPYAVVLSLPVFSLYSLAYLISTAGQGKGFVLDASHYAFALWTFAATLALVVVWPQFWFPRVAEPTYQFWVTSRREAIQGLEDFIKETEPPKSAEPSQKPKDAVS